MNKKFRKKFGKCLQIQKVTTFASAIEREILDKKDGPFVYRLGRKIFILERGFDSPRATKKKAIDLSMAFYLVALLCAGYVGIRNQL